MSKGRCRCGSALCYETALLGGDHVQVELGRHVRVQLDLNLVTTGGLDRARQLDLALVEHRATGGLDRVGDLGRGDRAEEPPALAGPRRQGDLQALELALDLVGVAEVANLAAGTRPLDRVDLLLGTLGPRDREALGQQVVAAVAVLDLDNIAGSAKVGHLIGKDDLHEAPPLSDRWWCTAGAPSHGRS